LQTPETQLTQLASLAGLATRLGRRLVLPNAAGPAVSVCQPLELGTQISVPQLLSQTGLNATQVVTWPEFTAFSSRRTLVGRKPLSARAIVAVAGSGENRQPELIAAAAVNRDLDEWPCLRTAALDIAPSRALQIMRPGSHAEITNPLGLSKYGEWMVRALAQPVFRKSVDVLVVSWQFEGALFGQPGPAVVAESDTALRIDWRGAARSAMLEANALAVARWEADAPAGDELCARELCDTLASRDMAAGRLFRASDCSPSS